MIYFGIYGIPTLADRRKQLKLRSLFQMMNGQISFPMANAPLEGRPALNLRNWILIFLYNQLYTQVHISFPSFPMLSLCGTNYQNLWDSPFIQALYPYFVLVDSCCTCSYMFMFPLSFCYLLCIDWVHSIQWNPSLHPEAQKDMDINVRSAKEAVMPVCDTGSATAAWVIAALALVAM